MRKSLLVIAALALSVFVARAGELAAPKPDKASGKLLPLKRATSSNSCAAYGPGFVKIEGTETCVKVGGAVSIGVGGSAGSR
jgi:hypothetical protein